MGQYGLQVDGMSCTGCEERVTNATKRVEGVRQIDVDHEFGTAQVTAGEYTEGAVRQAIHDAGCDVPA